MKKCTFYVDYFKLNSKNLTASLSSYVTFSLVSPNMFALLLEFSMKKTAIRKEIPEVSWMQIH